MQLDADVTEDGEVCSEFAMLLSRGRAQWVDRNAILPALVSPPVSTLEPPLMSSSSCILPYHEQGWP